MSIASRDFITLLGSAAATWPNVETNQAANNRR
jgi:hypothetical protein